MKQPLTAIIPCKDESKNIRHCIESFHSVADEILIADSGSSDDTMRIAESFAKVRIIEREYNFSGDFKNWAIPHASHEWVLIVDADERVTPELAQEIQTVLASTPDKDGYWIKRNNFFFGHRLHHGDAQTDTVMRLFKRDLGRYVGPSDHGEVHISTDNVGQLKECFDHFCLWDYDTYFRKFHRYTSFQAKQWYDEGKDTSYFKLLIRPMFRFFREFILQGSIFDGKLGIQTAWMAAMYSFMKQARLWEMNHAMDPHDPQSSYLSTLGLEEGVTEIDSETESPSEMPTAEDSAVETSTPRATEKSHAA